MALACNVSCSFPTFVGGIRLTPISRLSPLRTLAWNQGPFPRPALPGFVGTMDLSDSPGGPVGPSRVSGWGTPPPPGVSRVAFALRVLTCPRPYPGGIVAGIGLLPGQRRRRPSPNVRWVGSRVNRFGACLAFTPVRACRLAGSPSDPLHRRLRPFRYLHDRSDCYWLEQQLPGGNCTH